MSSQTLYHDILYLPSSLSSTGVKQPLSGVVTVKDTQMLIIPKDSEHKFQLDLKTATTIKRTKSTKERPRYKVMVVYTSPTETNANLVIDFLNPPEFTVTEENFATCPAAMALQLFCELVDQSIAASRAAVSSSVSSTPPVAATSQAKPPLGASVASTPPATSLKPLVTTGPPTSASGLAASGPTSASPSASPSAPALAPTSTRTLIPIAKPVQPAVPDHIRIPTQSEMVRIFELRPELSSVYLNLTKGEGALTAQEFWQLHQDIVGELVSERQLAAIPLSQPRRFSQEELQRIRHSELEVDFSLSHRVFSQFPEVLRAYVDNVIAGLMTESNFWRTFTQQVSSIFSGTPTSIFLEAKETCEREAVVRASTVSTSAKLAQTRAAATENPLARSLLLDISRVRQKTPPLGTSTGPIGATGVGGSGLVTGTPAMDDITRASKASTDVLERSLASQGLNLKANAESMLDWGPVLEETGTGSLSHEASAALREENQARAMLIRNLNQHSTLLTSAISSIESNTYGPNKRSRAEVLDSLTQPMPLTESDNPTDTTDFRPFSLNVSAQNTTEAKIPKLEPGSIKNASASGSVSVSVSGSPSPSPTPSPSPSPSPSTGPTLSTSKSSSPPSSLAIVNTPVTSPSIRNLSTIAPKGESLSLNLEVELRPEQFASSSRSTSLKRMNEALLAVKSNRNGSKTNNSSQSETIEAAPAGSIPNPHSSSTKPSTSTEIAMASTVPFLSPDFPPEDISAQLSLYCFPFYSSAKTSSFSVAPPMSSLPSPNAAFMALNAISSEITASSATLSFATGPSLGSQNSSNQSLSKDGGPRPVIPTTTATAAKMTYEEAQALAKSLTHLCVQLCRHYWSSVDNPSSIQPEKRNTVYTRLGQLLRNVDMTRKLWNEAGKSNYSSLLNPLFTMTTTVSEHFARLKKMQAQTQAATRVLLPQTQTPSSTVGGGVGLPPASSQKGRVLLHSVSK